MRRIPSRKQSGFMRFLGSLTILAIAASAGVGVVDLQEARAADAPDSAPMEVQSVGPSYARLSQPLGSQSADLDSLIAHVLPDSIESYAQYLESVGYRVSGTAANDVARDWLFDRFLDFGYDSVVIDTFTAVIESTPTECHNVIAYKIGTEFPEYQVITGAHRDAVPNCPGADDNGSGTYAVLEVARALQNVPTRMTHVFILFDAEEWGLLGSSHYANGASQRQDSIVLMLNMDMIGHFENDSQAWVNHADDSTYAEIWRDLAGSLDQIGIQASLYATRSDNFPFTLNGYNAIFAHEYIGSTHYHQPSDSIAYLNFDYLTRMTKASLATAYVAGETYEVTPLVFTLMTEVPPLCLPRLATPLLLQIAEQGGGVLVPGSVELHFAIGGGELQTVPMSHIGDGQFEAAIPPLSCYSEVTFYFSAQDVGAGTLYYPDTSQPFRSYVATGIAETFTDDFNSDLGWQVSGDVTQGMWERVIPNPAYHICGAPGRDYDGSEYCYLTDSRRLIGVTEGTTNLISPGVATPGGDARIQYARSYSNYCDVGGDPYNDTMKIFVRRNGSSWVLAETVGPVEEATGEWIAHRFWVGDFFEPGDSVYVWFQVSDQGPASIVEAAVDDFSVSVYSCDPLIITESLPDWTLGISYDTQLHAVGCCSTFSWADKYDELSGTGLSLSADGLVSGIPDSAGAIAFTAVVTDTAGQSGEWPYAFSINPAVSIEIVTLPAGQLGKPYSFQLTAVGGTGVHSWVDRDGDLSGTGLALGSDGVLAGAPVDTATIGFIARVADEVGAADEQPLSLVVGPAYLCGDVDGDGEGANVADLTYLVAYLFSGGPAPPIEAAANVDGLYEGELAVTVSDLTYLVDYLFGGGPEPVCE